MIQNPIGPNTNRAYPQSPSVNIINNPRMYMISNQAKLIRIPIFLHLPPAFCLLSSLALIAVIIVRVHKHPQRHNIC